MAESKPTKKQKFLKFLAISSVIISLLLSSMALHYATGLDELESGDDGGTTLSKTGALYSTHGCEDGGFSIQSGLDINEDGVLENSEVTDIKNVCHGTQGPPGPMGNRGYWGYNGTNGSDGIDGMNGTDGDTGVSAFIDSFVGEYGPCGQAAIIEMGNNSTSGIVDSSVKICFEELESGRLTDIHPNTGNSFSSGCNGGMAHADLFVFAAARDGNCLLYKIQSGELEQVSNNIDFAPGSILGFIVHKDKIWFDANDGTGTQLWSTDGNSLLKETNLPLQIQEGDKMIAVGGDLILQHGNGLAIFGDSYSYTSGSFSNLTSANEALIYNSLDKLNLNGTLLDAEINSDAVYHDGHYWFIATTDNDGPQLHRSDSQSIEKMTTNLHPLTGQIISPTIIGDNIVFDSQGVYSYDTVNLTLTEMNSSIQNIGSSTNWILSNGKIWFQCGIPGLGYELCVSDGVNAWLHSDYAIGMDSSSPKHFAMVGEKILALVDHPSEGGQLVEISEEGVNLLWDYHSGNFDAGSHGEIWVGSQMLFFIGDDASVGLEMYGWAHGELSEEWIVIH